MKPEDALGLTFYSEDLHETISIKDYFKRLICMLGEEAEGFSGKRPFGNSGWEYDVYGCLIANGATFGTLDDDGYNDECNIIEADEYVQKIIAAL